MRSKRQAEPEPLEIKAFSQEEIAQGIAKLRRRIDEVRALDPSKVQFNDASVQNVEQGIRWTIQEVFGPRSPEYDAHQHHQIWQGGHNYLDQDADLQEKFAAGIPQTVTMLGGLVARLEEKRQDLGFDATSRARDAFRSLDLHPRIAAVASRLYLDGHYSEAVFNASKALINFVQEKSSRFDLDGAPLVRTVFSANSPILLFNDLVDQSDRDEQEGMMHLFEGAVLGIRNPRGHSFLDDAPDRALEYIALLSLLAKRLEETKRR